MNSEIRRKQVQLHNQDLDIIIANLTILKGYTSDEADELLDEAINVAVRMAKEIHDLRANKEQK